MGTKDSSRDADSHRMGSPIQGAAILLVIFIAIYLAVSGVVHGLVSPDVAAIAPDSSLTLASAATGLNRPATAGQSPTSGSFDEVSSQADSSRECRPSAATNSRSLCD